MSVRYKKMDRVRILKQSSALFVFMWFFFQSGLTAVAQEQFVILPTREVTVKVAIDEIGRQAEYKLVVDWTKVDAERKTLYSSSRLTVKDILAQTFDPQRVRWTIENKSILIESVSGDRTASLLPQMKIVKDPLSDYEISPTEMARIRDGYRPTGIHAVDSLMLAVFDFRVNSVVLEKDYMNNPHTVELLRRIFTDKKLVFDMDFITITATASPEGPTPNNQRLADGRALAAKSHLMQQYPFLDRNRIFTFSIVEDWVGMRKMVQDDPNVPQRNEVISIIDSGESNDRRRELLKELDRGAAYRYLTTHIFPHLRGAATCMIYFKEIPEPIVIRESTVDTVRLHTHSSDTIIIERELLKEKSSNIFYYSLKTNLVYDAMLLPNLAFEFSLPKRWSIQVGGKWSWWNTPTTHHNCWRIQVVDLELRKWLGGKERTPLTGFNVGAYAMAGTYDVRFGGKTGNLSNMSRSFGLAAGYATPIGKRLNLEFSLGAGYLGGKYYTYTYDEKRDVFPWTGTKRRNYLGLTKLEVSLVWLPGSGTNKNWKSVKNDYAQRY